MKINRKKAVIKLIMIIIFLIILLPLTQGRMKLSKGVTAKNIRKIKIGMDKEKVVEILGKPLKIKKMPEEYYGKNYEKLYFSENIRYCKWCPIVLVICKENKVIEVYVQVRDIFQDMIIYNISNNPDDYEVKGDDLEKYLPN